MKTTTKTTVFKNAALPYHPGVTRRRRTSTRACYTDDVMRKNDVDKSKARHACTDVSIRRRRAGKGLVNHARRMVLSQASTRRYKHCMWVVKTTVLNLILRMQELVFMLISTCIWIVMESTPMMLNKEQKLSKYTEQLFEGKIKLLQIPETYNEGSEEGEINC